MQVFLGMDFSQGDRLLAVVPMFHANAWGLPYAALMSGSSLIMPDRFLQAEPLARMIETERVTGGGAVPTIWNDLLRYLDEHPTDISSVRSVVVGGVRVPAGADAGDARAARHHGDPRLGHDRDVAARLDGRPAGRDARARSTGATARPRGGIAPGVQARLVGPDGAEQPWDGEQRGRARGQGPVDHRLLLRQRLQHRGRAGRRQPSSTTAGCAPVTSAR